MKFGNGKMNMPVPTESQEQITLMNWADINKRRYPELSFLYHVPNGGRRSKSEAARFRAEGVKPGVPDLCLPVARGGYHGLYIEMKRRKGGVVSDEQKRWVEELRKNGYCAVICKGWEEAASALMEYLGQ